MSQRIMREIPQGLKPLELLRLFGTTEVVPFHEAFYETSSSKETRAVGQFESTEGEIDPVL
jgi:hypothetical protein